MMEHHEHIDPKCSCRKMSWLERKFGKMPKGWNKVVWYVVTFGLFFILLAIAYGIAMGTFSFTGLF